MEPDLLDFTTIAHELRDQGFVRRRGSQVTPWLQAQGLTGWDEFAASWDDLGLDRYMADQGRYRRRRHAVFTMADGVLTREPHRPHYQTTSYNPLNGGIERWFEPVRDEIARHPALLASIALAWRGFDAVAPGKRWEIELHQFRITAGSEAGKPTPEGMHRDGVDYVMVMLVRRENVQSGTTTIEDMQRRQLDSFTLAEPLDVTMLDDHRVYHGVTPIVPLDPARPGWRDVLVATFREKQPG